MKYAMNKNLSSVAACNGSEMMQVGAGDIMVTTGTDWEDFQKFCTRHDYTSCTREEFNRIYIRSSKAINELAKQL